VSTFSVPPPTALPGCGHRRGPASRRWGGVPCCLRLWEWHLTPRRSAATCTHWLTHRSSFTNPITQEVLGPNSSLPNPVSRSPELCKILSQLHPPHAVRCVSEGELDRFDCYRGLGGEKLVSNFRPLGIAWRR